MPSLARKRSRAPTPPMPPAPSPASPTSASPTSASPTSASPTSASPTSASPRGAGTPAPSPPSAGKPPLRSSSFPPPLARPPPSSRVDRRVDRLRRKFAPRGGGDAGGGGGGSGGGGGGGGRLGRRAPSPRASAVVVAAAATDATSSSPPPPPIPDPADSPEATAVGLADGGGSGGTGTGGGYRGDEPGLSSSPGSGRDGSGSGFGADCDDGADDAVDGVAAAAVGDADAGADVDKRGFDDSGWRMAPRRCRRRNSRRRSGGLHSLEEEEERDDDGNDDDPDAADGAASPLDGAFAWSDVVDAVDALSGCGCDVSVHSDECDERRGACRRRISASAREGRHRPHSSYDEMERFAASGISRTGSGGAADVGNDDDVAAAAATACGVHRVRRARLGPRAPGASGGGSKAAAAARLTASLGRVRRRGSRSRARGRPPLSPQASETSSDLSQSSLDCPDDASTAEAASRCSSAKAAPKRSLAEPSTRASSWTAPTPSSSAPACTAADRHHSPWPLLKSSAAVGAGGKEFRVKPYGAYGKTYLTEDELVREMLRPSERFERPRSGELSKSKSTSGRKHGRRRAVARRWSDPRSAKAKAAAAAAAAAASRLGAVAEDGGDSLHLDDCDCAERELGADRGTEKDGDGDGDGDGEDDGDAEDDGRIGTLSVEVLSCVGLPKFDRFSKPDAAVYLILGDCAFATDAIPSSLSPMWPSRSRRAVSFPVHHAYARLYAGVFGVESRKEKENDDFVGRASIDVAVLRPNTEYDAMLPLRTSTFVYDRRPRGVVRLRFRLAWDSERAAVLSYLRSPPSPAADGAGQLTIPCADAKTFRNVALAVHGENLPGKYSQRAFRATMREAALYQIQLRHLAKTLANDAVTYQRPVVSMYLFGAWMHCVYRNSMGLVPAYLVGYALFLYMNNYVAFHLDPARHGGYMPVTIAEIVRALLGIPGGGGFTDSETGRQPAMRPLSVDKRTANSNPNGGSDESPRDFEPNAEQSLMDHAVFPFSERRAYPSRTVSDALVQRSKSNGSTEKLSSRLGTYAKTFQRSLSSGPEAEDSRAGKDVDNDDDDNDDQVSLDGSDEDDEYDIEEEEEEEEECGPSLVSGTHRSLFVFSSDPSGRSIPVGPQQDVNVLPKRRAPFKQNLAKFEDRFHAWTFRLFDDRVCCAPPDHPHRQARRGCPPPRGAGGVVDRYRTKKRRKVLDDFDRRLGLRARDQNPLVALTAEYLGPVQNMARIWVSVVRVFFNVGAWKDPYLSFWFLCFLLALAFVMAIFPWRSFMFVSGIVLVGPQNMALKRIARKGGGGAAHDREEGPAAPESTGSVRGTDTPAGGGDGASDATGGGKSELPAERRPRCRGSKFPRIGRGEKKKKKTTNGTTGAAAAAAAASDGGGGGGDGDGDSDDDPPGSVRPAFSAQSGKLAQKSMKKNLTPRSVVVPYSRLRKERFYDWPPDPNVSRAAPVSDRAAGYRRSGRDPDEPFANGIDAVLRERSGGIRRRFYTG